jgi:hypothetical protein
MQIESLNYKKHWQKQQRSRKGSEENAYVYVHIRNDNSEPFYVGIGWTHTRPWNYVERTDWHKKISRKHGVRTEIVIDSIPLETAKFWEAKWIKSCKDAGYILVNCTSGGDANPMEIPEVRKKQKDNVPKGDDHYTKTDEARENLRLKNTGKKYSEETNKKKGRSGPKLNLTDEGRAILKLPKKDITRQKMRIYALNMSDEHHQKLSAAAIKMWEIRSSDQRSAVANKGWETRRRNKLLKEI